MSLSLLSLSRTPIMHVLVQFSRSVVSDSATPWTAARQAFLSITNSRSLLKLRSIELVMPPSHLILCRPCSSCLPSFPVSQLFALGGQSIGVSASASVLPMNIQDWFPLGWTETSRDPVCMECCSQTLRQETETTLGISSRKRFYTENEDVTKSLEE